MEPQVQIQQLEEGTRLVVSGEIDVSNADVLRDALSDALAAEPQSIEVDLAAVSYIDSTGIGALVGASKRADEAGIAFAVARPQRNVGRVLALLGLEEDLHVFDVRTEENDR